MIYFSRDIRIIKFSHSPLLPLFLFEVLELLRTKLSVMSAITFAAELY